MIDDDVLAGMQAAFRPDFMLILAHGNGPRPAGDYGTVRIESSASAPAHTGELTVNQPIPAFGARELAAHHAGQLEVQVFAADAMGILSEAVLTLDSLAAIDAADAAGVVFGRAQQLQSVPALRNTAEYEPRAVATIPFSYTRRVIEPVPVIETVEGSVSVPGAPPVTFRSHHGEN